MVQLSISSIMTSLRGCGYQDGKKDRGQIEIIKVKQKPCQAAYLSVAPRGRFQGLQLLG